MPQATMRAGQMKAELASAEQLPQAAAIKAALRPETLKAITEAKTAAWLPLELDVELNEAVLEAVGEEATRAWARQAMLKSFEGPLLRPLVDACVKLFGMSPLSWIKWIPQLWRAMVRDGGQLEVVEDSANSATLAYQDVPPFASSPGFLVSMCGAFEGALALTHHQGRVSYLVDDTRKAVFFKATWG